MDWTAIKDAVDYTADCIYDVINWLRPDADGDTAVYWGGYVHGACWYYYNNDGDLAREDGTYTFNTSNDTAYVIASGEHVSYFLTLYDDTSLTTPYISNQLPYYIGLSSSGRYRIKGMSNGISFLDAGTEFKLASPTNGSPKTYTSLGTASGSNFDFKMSGVPAVSTVSNISATIQIPEIYDKNVSYNDILILLVDKANDIAEQESISETFTIDDLPSWEEQQGTTEETETETSCCGCNCGDTIIYVNADGTVTVSNSVSGDYTLNIDNNADLSVQIQALAGAFGAGAFGAGAIVIDPEAEINFTAGAGAFGAGAFGAGAIVAPNVDVNGSVEVGDISGEVNLNVSDISLEVSGGDVNIDQSGSTVTNNYNTTNNYYGTTEPVEPEQPFTIDYDEILSERELESILNQETYEIIEIHTETEQQIEIPETIPGTIAPLPGEIVTTSGTIFNYGNDIIADLGLLPVYAPLSIFSIVCYILRGCK